MKKNLFMALVLMVGVAGMQAVGEEGDTGGAPQGMPTKNPVDEKSGYGRTRGGGTTSHTSCGIF